MIPITGSEPAMPRVAQAMGTGSDYYEVPGSPGLTIRQYYAGLAMQGMLSACNGFDNKGVENLAMCAVQQADALINELNKRLS